MTELKVFFSIILLTTFNYQIVCGQLSNSEVDMSEVDALRAQVIHTYKFLLHEIVNETSSNKSIVEHIFNFHKQLIDDYEPLRKKLRSNFTLLSESKHMEFLLYQMRSLSDDFNDLVEILDNSKSDILAFSVDILVNNVYNLKKFQTSEKYLWSYSDTNVYIRILNVIFVFKQI